MKFPYLHLQLWDRDVLKWNDCAGEGAIDLGKFYRKAYKRNVAIKMFETKKGGVAKRANKREKLSRQVRDTEDDIPPTEDNDEDDDNVMNPLTSSSLALDGVETEGGVEEQKSDINGRRRASLSVADRENDIAKGFIIGPAVSPHANRLMMPPRNEPDSDDDDYVDGVDSDDDDDFDMDLIDDDDDDDGNKISKSPHKPPQKKRRIFIKHPSYLPPKRMRKKKVSQKKKTGEDPAVPSSAVTSSSWLSRLMFWRKEPAYLLDDDGNFILDEDGNKIVAAENDSSTEDEKSDDNDELRALINSFKNMTGLWDIDPEDSAWYHLVRKDKNDPKAKDIAMGSICFSVQIWPKDKADMMKSGAGRSEPNTNPFCPPPTGRLQFTWNPFVMGAELLGPKVCFYIMALVVCAVFITLMFVCQPFLNIVINLIFVVY